MIEDDSCSNGVCPYRKKASSSNNVKRPNYFREKELSDVCMAYYNPDSGFHGAFNNGVSNCHYEGDDHTKCNIYIQVYVLGWTRETSKKE